MSTKRAFLAKNDKWRLRFREAYAKIKTAYESVLFLLTLSSGKTKLHLAVNFFIACCRALDQIPVML